MTEELRQTARLNFGDDALAIALVAMARIIEIHIENGEQFIADLKEMYLELARHPDSGEVARNVYLEIAGTLTPKGPPATPSSPP